MVLLIEALDKDQLAAKRELRSLNITLIKADTPAKVQQVKLIQQLNVALLTSTEDALIIPVAAQPEENMRPRWREAIKLQQRGVFSRRHSRSLRRLRRKKTRRGLRTQAADALPPSSMCSEYR
jgi:hypothetical protein